MNKKFTMVVAALLAMGTSVFAQSAFTGTLSDGMKVYLGENTTNKYLNVESVALYGGAPTVTTFDDATVDFTPTPPQVYVISDYHKLSDKVATFKLKAGDQYVNVKSADSEEADNTVGINGITTLFQISLSDGKVTSASTIKAVAEDGTLASGELKVGTYNALICVANPSAALKAEALNTAANGTFTVSFKDAEDNVFNENNLKAFEVSVTGVQAGTYFATSWPTSLNGTSEISDMARFQQCTFIAVDPNTHTGIFELGIKDGDGFAFTEVSGRNLLKTDDTKADNIKNGKVPSANAAFAVNVPDPLNGEGNYSMKTVAKVWAFTEADKPAVELTTLNVGAVKDKGVVSVVTLSDASFALETVTKTFTLGQTNVESAETFLSKTGAKVYNIQFVSKTAGTNTASDSEYGKYLGVGYNNNAAAHGLFAQGSDFLNLKAAQNQWIVIDADLDENIVVFQNREDATKTLSAKLVKTSNANEFKVVETAETAATFGYAYVAADGTKTYSAANNSSINGTTIKLTEVTVNPTEGFVTNELDNAGLIKMAFEVETAVNPTTLYLAEKADDDDAIELNKEEAINWEVIKFDSDTIYSYNSYAYLAEKDGKKEVKTAVDKDTIAVVSFAFKQFGKDYRYLKELNGTTQSIATNITDITDASKFVIKKNVDGSYALIPAGTETDYRNIVEDDTEVLDLTVATLAFDETNVYADHNAKFVIEGETFGESLEHKSQHVTFKDAKLGAYLAVGEEGNGIVAPVSELKASYTAADLTFWLDTTNSEAIVPEFYITKGSKEFMYNAIDSAEYYNEGTASGALNKDYYLPNTTNARAIFRAATLKDSNTLVTTIKGEEKELTAGNGLEAYKFNIFKNEDGDYVVRSVKDGLYLYNLNGELGFTSALNAMGLEVETAEAPTSNESVSASEVKVIANNGSVVVKNAAGKNVVVSTILGQVVANEVLTSDNATINVPAGIVVVAVEGESFKVNVK